MVLTLGYLTLLELINISLKWNSPKEKPFIKNLNLKIYNGNILCVFGKSGVGKSSLINVIAGTTEDNLSFEGKIILNGKILNNIPIEKRKIGLLLQDGALFPHLTVEQNIYFGMNRKLKSKEKLFLINENLKKANKVKKVKNAGAPDSPDLRPAGLGGDWTGAIWNSGWRSPETPAGPFHKDSLPE